MLNCYACRIHSLDYISLYCGYELRIEALELNYLDWLKCDSRRLLG